MDTIKKISIAILGLIAILVLVMYSGIQIQEQSIASQATGTEEGIVKRMLPLSYATCTPDTGYDYCDQNSYNHGDAAAAVKMHSTEVRGNDGYGTIEGQNAHYYIGEAYINVKLEYGDEIYVRRSSTEWNTCGRDNCGGQNIGMSAKYIVAIAPAKNPAHVDFTGYDFDGDAWDYGYWTWTAVYRGWVGDTSNFDFYVIGCYNDEDGNGVNEYCDKSGTWDTWELKTDPYAALPITKNECDGFSNNEYTRELGSSEYVFSRTLEWNSGDCGYTYPTTDTTAPTTDPTLIALGIIAGITMLVLGVIMYKNKR